MRDKMKTIEKIQTKIKGFTLVELIVTVSILGIISMLAMPVIDKVVENNNLTKMETYAETVINSAKLYVDSYGEDLFTSDKECQKITFRMMVEKNLLKDISIEDISCDRSGTFVKVCKNGNKYKYDVYLACGKKGDNSVTYVYPPNDSNNPYSFNAVYNGIS